eukprot:gnl/MRDRNA2_/MRDRNA2_133890_c0_seq1.p1 gnl/MRDRNA2_/MRDRNA2_133890_c0~~gnl/MRDRNA2_/MRDRNA2_133890_c0_seq1.p1  ORF type:complete len:254 (+),score=23.09 gnl/MRDRNA2_/MRDRNA2_133890_c0_seq1:75-836(+)
MPAGQGSNNAPYEALEFARAPDGPGGDKAGETKAWQDEEIASGKYTFKKAILQVTVRCPDKNPISWIAVTYGFLPWIIPALFAMLYIVWRRFIGLYAICLSLACAALNEAVLKPIIKQPRPDGTAHRYPDGRPKYGMPSGHVFNAFALMVWALLEVGLHGPEDRVLTKQWLALILVLMLPVPWARWYNQDHSVGQVGVSTILGLVFGIAAYALRIQYFSGHWKPWAQSDWTPWSNYPNPVDAGDSSARRLLFV